MMAQKTVEVQGVNLWTESLGDPAHPSLLLISGAGAHAHFWSDPFCQRLVEGGYHVIRYDHRDSGLSQSSQGEYGIDELAGDALGILNDYNLRDAHVVGHSMGGYIVQFLAATYPARIKSAASIAAGPIGETPSLLKPQTVEEMAVIRETWSTLVKNRPTTNFEESLEGFMDVWRRLNGKASFDETRARHYTEELYTRSRYPVGVHDKHSKAMQKMAQELKSHAELLSRIHCPFLIIQGLEDYLMLPERGGLPLKEALTHAQLVMIPKLGHLFFNEEMEGQIAERLLIFLNSVEHH